MSPADAPRRWVAIAAMTAVALGAAGVLASDRAAMPAWAGFTAGALAGTLAVLALPSIPTRTATTVILGIGGLLVAQNAGAGQTPVALVAVWATATIFALVAMWRITLDAVPAWAGSQGRVRPTDVVVGGGATIVIAALVAVVAAPIVNGLVRPESLTGSPPTQSGFDDAPPSLRANDSLDMTRRPRLSDTIVLRVVSDRPDFWRGETFDVWDGRTWTRSDPRIARVRSSAGTAVVAPEADALGSPGEQLRQTFRVESDYAEVVFGASAITSVDGGRRLFQRADGTVVALGGLGYGATYTVTSERVGATAELLRGADAATIPAAILARYAQPPVITARTAELAQRVTASAPTTYDKIRALESWLGANTEYSIEAPLSPQDTDIIDHFLFESNLGWCQQVASSLAVMARHLGIPARVAVGFVPGTYDALVGEWVVRERDAHQWVEVYFPGIGWQGFDPTASVPLAGDAQPVTHAARWLTARVEWLVAAGVVVGLGVLAVLVVRRTRARRRFIAARSWSAALLADLESVGEAAGRPRQPSETPAEFSEALARALDEPELVSVGVAIDADAFAAHDLGPESRRRAEDALGGVVPGSSGARW